MKILAIYAINQHLADLYREAEHERLLRQIPRKPSAFRLAIASIRSAIADRTSGPTRTTAPAAS